MFLFYNFIELLNIHLFIEKNLFVAILYKLSVLSMLAIKKNKVWSLSSSYLCIDWKAHKEMVKTQCSESNVRQMQNHEKSSELASSEEDNESK